jgi:lysozyme
MDLYRTRDQIERHEGLRLKPYKDSVGKLTIGIGRNLDDVGITEDEAYTLFYHDIKNTMMDLDRNVKWWIGLDAPRQAVLINMAFNLGIDRFLKFKLTLAAVKRGDYDLAAEEMLDSKWATQVGSRATELSKQMQLGEW